MSIRMDSNMIKVPDVCWIQFRCVKKYCTKRGADTKFSDKAENNWSCGEVAAVFWKINGKIYSFSTMYLYIVYVVFLSLALWLNSILITLHRNPLYFNIYLWQSLISYIITDLVMILLLIQYVYLRPDILLFCRHILIMNITELLHT